MKGGVVTTDLTPHGTDEFKRYTVGPVIEVKLPHRFAIEAGALYKRTGTSSSISLFPPGTSQVDVTLVGVTRRVRGNSWEVPVLGKYYFRPYRSFTPFLSSGWALRRIWTDVEGVSVGNLQPPVVPAPYRYSDKSDLGVGAVVAAGARFQYGHFKFAPELRYTRWGAQDAAYRTNRNQLEVLFGITF